MKQIFETIKKRPLTLLLIALPLAILAEVLHWGEVWVFILSAVAIIPFAELIGEATEALADYTGPRIGGLLNATYLDDGNCITVFVIGSNRIAGDSWISG